MPYRSIMQDGELAYHVVVVLKPVNQFCSILLGITREGTEVIKIKGRSYIGCAATIMQSAMDIHEILHFVVILGLMPMLEYDCVLTYAL